MRFDLNVPEWLVAWTGFIQGVGCSIFWVPLSVVTLRRCKQLPGRWLVSIPSSTQLRVKYFHFYFRNGHYPDHTDELCGMTTYPNNDLPLDLWWALGPLQPLTD